jgi:PelA/Pel-15E family pectate lyase
MFHRAAAAALMLMTGAASASVVGTLVKYEGITPAAIAALPAADQKAWSDYLARSAQAHRHDVETLSAERQGLNAVPAPVSDSFHDKSVPLDKPAAWYGSDEAKHEADVIVSFQTPSGGWGKNQDFTRAARAKGQFWIPAENGKEDWHYVGTIDNDATWLQLQFLARVIAAAPEQSAPWKASVLNGVDYLLAAELPGGGWPQIWPLEGGYHDALTYNDNAFVNTARMLAQVAADAGGLYGFVPMQTRLKAAAAVKRAEAVLLKTQVTVDGKRTIWAQQVDPLTLQPASARAFEPAALSATESASLLLFLMSDPDPSPQTVMAVHDGIAFLNAVAIKDKAWVKAAGSRVMQDVPGARVWARYYDLKTLKPVFGDRDMSIHDDVNDLSPERRDSYSWYNTGPEKALKKYPAWASKHPRP